MTHALTGGSSAFHSVVYFINTNYMNELKWGTTDPIIVQDPEEQVNVHVRAYGLFGVHIEQNDPGLAPIQARKFLVKVVGTRSQYTREELTSFMRAKILEYVPDLLAKSIIERGISVLKISAYLSEFSSLLQERLSAHFDSFGLALDNFSFNSIKPFEDDLAALNQAKIVRQTSILEAQGNAAKMDIESEALARKRAREGFTYQQERGMDVMQSAASNEGGGALGSHGRRNGSGHGRRRWRRLWSGLCQPGKPSRRVHGGGGGATHTACFCPGCRMSCLWTCQPRGRQVLPGVWNKLERGKACPACGHVNPPEAKFCLECGIRLGAPVCPDCGAQLPGGTKFCPNCGRKIQ